MIFKNLIVLILLMMFILTCESSYSQSGDTEFSSDKSILKTDNEGNILGGDEKDWDFDISRYSNVIDYKDYFFQPVYKDSNYVLFGDPVAMFSEIKENTVTLSWIASNKLDTKNFLIERKSVISDNWEVIESIDHDNSSLETKYKFVDHKIDDGIYEYRLKYSEREYVQYYELPNFVIAKEKDVFEFYPAYPNPVKDNVTFSFYVPEKDIVSLFFMNDKNKDTTYVLDHEPQERGYYIVTVDKESLGFDNEIKRLYIDCESCNKKRNFGDVQF